MASVGITREAGETWRQAAERYAARHGLEDEVLSEFDEAVAAGEPEDEAAWGACLEWDVLDLVPMSREEAQEAANELRRGMLDQLAAKKT